ncbi:MAG TPA: tyrosine--tRNA ligase [Streptosporangiaceae bacterium]|nr:tyrosine--tRNA ligase [Streptosporangiaceae bacterium]
MFDSSATLQRTAEQVFSAPDLRQKLASGRPLRIKYGVDVTAPFLHIGHAVNLWAMRELQEAGHKVILLIGDFTTRIGDPTGKSATRPVIPAAQIDRDAGAFISQASQVLLTDPAVFEVRRNSEWWSPMPLERFLELLSLATHARLIQRDMFQRRMASGTEIYLHELLYPVLQGYDSVELESDLTIVGTDQLFNELMGRFYQERLGHQPQVVITTAITPGIDGREKQSKSLGNYIALADSARDMFGKAMKLPDSLAAEYLRVYTLIPLAEIEGLERAMAAGELNPMEAKRRLGQALVERYYGAAAAAGEDEWFTRVFSRHAVPQDVPVIRVTDPDVTLIELLRACLPEHSSTQLRRLVRDGSVRLDGEHKLTDPEQRHPVSGGAVVRVGKRRWFRITFGA